MSNRDASARDGSELRHALNAAEAMVLEGHSLYPQLRHRSMNRAVLNPHRGQSTARSGLDTSTYRGLLATATFDFGFYPVADPPRRAILGSPIYFNAVTARKAPVIVRAPLTSAGLVLAAILLSSCGTGGLSPIFPTPVSPNGQGIYDLYLWISIPAIIVFLGVEASLLWVVLKYRRSRQPLGYIPPQIHGHNGLEVAWTVAPLVIVLVIAGFSFAELQRDFQPVTNPAMTIVVSAHQFGWEYRYPMNGIVVHQEGTLAGDVTPFVVPTNTLIKLQFDSTDVIHSWWVPAITGKTDAVPGYDNFSWMKIDQPGTWRGECAELCGAGHSTMQIIVQAMSQSDFNQWVQQQAAAQPPSASPSASPS
jgi:cytochrome c oxidase subunit 2